jgi:hypothetical protein
MPKEQRESIAKLKKQIRDCERLLARPNLPPHIQISQQRKLKALQSQALPQAITQKKEDTIAAKYKMVKFFEHEKIMKRLKRALKTPQPDTQLMATLKQQLNYVAHFPRNRGYISLFPRHPCTDQSVLQEQSAIMSAIDERVRAGEVEDASENLTLNKKNQQAESEDHASDVEPKAKKNRKHPETEEQSESEEEDLDEEDEEQSESEDDDNKQDVDDGEEEDLDDEEDLDEDDEEDDEEYSEEEDDEEDLDEEADE